MREREKWVDAVKGMAIYLVILGHYIQYATSKDYNFASNCIFQIIYSFHMPLFMMMSGYLFGYSMNKYSIKDGIVAKIRGVLIPCIVWGIITYLIELVMYAKQKIGVLPIINYAYNSNWFLWAVFFTSVLVYFSVFIFKKKEIAFAFLLILNFIIPDTTQYFHIYSVRRLLLFFLAGVVINNKQILNRISKHYYWLALSIVMIIYTSIMFIVLKRGSYFSEQLCLVTGVRDVIKTLLNMLMQLSGCFSIVLIFYKLQQKFELHILCKLGEKSIVLYAFSGIVFYFLIKDYCRVPEMYRYRLKIVYVLLVSVIITGVSYFVALLIDRNKWTRKLLMGK